MIQQKAFLILFLTFNFFSIYGQRTIKGKVIDTDIFALPGVRIFENDTTLIGETDFNGDFEVLTSKDTNKLTFYWIGYDTTTITLSENCNYIEFILMATTLYHSISNKKIDSLRKKSFDKLPDLYLQAYNNGIFKTEKHCFKQEFVPIKSKLDEIHRQNKIIKKDIQNLFKELKIGDTVKVPSSDWSPYTDETDFGCLITGAIIDKNKKKNGYNLILKVTDNFCKKQKTTYKGDPTIIGGSIKLNMKYSKILPK